jgi:hypothetical protein
MKSFEEYLDDDAIIAHLCKLRVKIAKNRNEKHLIHLLTGADKFNYHINDSAKHNEECLDEFTKYENEFILSLTKLFPSRKKWIKLGEHSRVEKRTKQILSASDRNVYSLIKTIKRYRTKSPSEPWLLELDKFILDIRNSAINDQYYISKPIVYPKLRDKINTTENKCRPISLFSLKDRIILSITNKFLTDLFDIFFEDCSFAFRAKRNKDSSKVTHHDCIRNIEEYRAKNAQNDLWVVECDMDKFYDSVNHDIIKQQFFALIEKVKRENTEINLTSPVNIFTRFLESYCFNKNVLPLNTDSGYWEQYEIPNGEFAWVRDKFQKLSYYKDGIGTERIGIPQGGALSGLIANIVLNITDKEVLRTNAFYVRFCDDMLIIHPDETVCKTAKDVYYDSLMKLKLVPHHFCNQLIHERKKIKKNLPATTIEKFWAEKSKGPYKWTHIKDNGFPWIGFVGYELHFQGNIRVRKKSFRKELQKQEEVISQIKNAISKKRRKSIGSIKESAIHRLVGMSVGRITLRNYNFASNDLCWKNGFKGLFLNKYSSKQVKHLDRSRSKLYYDLVKYLEGLDDDDSAEDILPSKKRNVIHFNKPFSYFYQTLERSKNILLSKVPEQNSNP